MTKVAIVGSRDFPTDRYSLIQDFVKSLPKGTTIVSGGARGVDKVAEEAADKYALPTEIYPADWRPNGVYDPLAGYKRNPDIIAGGDRVVAFWDGKSRGTVNSIRLAMEAKKPLEIILPSGVRFTPSTLEYPFWNGNIYYAQGDLLESNAQVLVNPCNLKGAYGRGLSKQFADKFPWAAAQYVKACRLKEIAIGKPYMSSIEGFTPPNSIVCHFPTKNDWKHYSSLSIVEAGLKGLLEVSPKGFFKSWAFPMLGCGLGGLGWRKVQPLMEQYLGQLKADVVIYVDRDTWAKTHVDDADLDEDNDDGRYELGCE